MIQQSHTAEQAIPTSDQGGFRLGLLNHARYSLVVRLIHQRILSRVVKRIPRYSGDFRRSGLHPRDYIFLDLLVYVYTRAGKADLTRQVKNTPDTPTDRLVKISVWEDNAGTLATHLKGDSLEIAP